MRALICLLLLTAINLSTWSQTQSVLSEGKWVKMSFVESGIYKIDWSTLRDMGFEPSEIDPRNLAIYGNPGGMLPQALSEDRTQGLIENRIRVEGENDGVFNENDFLLFYVDEIDEVIFKAEEDEFEVKKNIYSDTIYYFLTHKNDPGLRIEEVADLGTDHLMVESHRSIISHELDLYNILSSGREWLGERLRGGGSLNFSLEMEDVKVNTELKLHLSAMAQANVGTSLITAINGNNLGELNFESIPNSQYAIKGNQQEEVFKINSNSLESQKLDLEFTFDPNGQNSATLYLNRFLIDFQSSSQFAQQQKFLRYTPSERMISTHIIQTENNNVEIWNISDPTRPSFQTYSFENDQVQFGAFSHAYREWIIFDPNELPKPEVFHSIENQNLLVPSNAELLIITHPKFYNEAQRLAQFRTSHDDMTVHVATVPEIYNEFSSGRQDITAIRDYIKLQYDQGRKLKYVLFFGKGSFDYKQRIEENTNYVPTYESRNSIHPLLSFSSDDYFGFLEDSEGTWQESPSGDHTLDIGIGRIPAKNIDEAKTAVEKIILYQTNPNTFGEWRSELLFVADDGDRNIHQRDADQLATLVDTTYQNFHLNKLYLDSYEQVRTPNGESSPQAEDALIDAVNEGRLIINFTGHGAEFGWMQERILTFDLMEEWQNPFKLPFLITATCEFGRNDDPQTESGAERLMFKKSGGAIGLLTTARPVFSSTNYRLNVALYDIMLQEEQEYPRLGDVIRFTKNNSLEGSLNRNFILLGDPSMRLNYPEKSIEVTEINGRIPSSNDTLKALQSIQLKGLVKDGDFTDRSFDGKVTVKLFDKAQERRTLGSDNEPFEYKERTQLLFNGQASVKNGQFELDFIVPKNIDYTFGKGKLQLYAFSENQMQDALGSSLDFTLGGSAEPAFNDQDGPQIQVYINDTTKQISGIYDEDLQVILKFNDSSGINISNAVIGQNPTLYVNDTLAIDISHQYIAEIDDFTRGEAKTRLTDLPEGINSLSITARDVHGNSSTKEVSFQVKAKSSFISEIKTYPNPFIDETRFQIGHSLIGENLEMEVEIIKRNGQKVSQLRGAILSAEEILEIKWNGRNQEGLKLEPGIYFYTFKIISNTSGKTDFKRGKLIISH